MYTYEKRIDKKVGGKISKPLPASRAGDRTAIQLRRRGDTQLPYGDEGIIQRIEPLHQTGANCGMFAMAMALADLVPGPSTLSRPYGEIIAKELEDYAINHGLSAIGEAFSAVDLALAGKWYCMSKHENDIKFVIAYFSTKKKMKDILEQSHAGSIYVLLPYLAGNPTDSYSVDPDTSSETIPRPEKMTHAHWSVIEEREAKYRILEGHKKIFGGPEHSSLGDERYMGLFKANQRLGDRMSWVQYISGLHNRGKSKELNKFYNSRRQGRDIDEGLNETVRLNSRAIIVGRRDAVDGAIENLLQIDPSFIYLEI